MALQSNNPVFARAEGFNGKGGSYAGYGDPSTWSTGAATASRSGQADTGTDWNPTHTGSDQGRMTIDSAVQKSAITLGLVVVTGALTWFLTPPLVDGRAVASLNAITLVSLFVGMGLGMFASFKRVISPALVLAYAAVEGVFVGALSKSYNGAFGDGVVTGAVIGTIMALAGTLAAYKFLGLKPGPKYYKWMAAVGMGLLGIILLDFVLGFFNAAIGFNGMGPLGLLMSVALLGFGVFSLIGDFGFVEQGVAAGLPERESWRAALGLTASLVLIYINLLRILAILRGD